MSLISNLVELQNIDTSIKSIEELQGDLPKNVEELKSSLSSLEVNILKSKKRLQEIEIETRKVQSIEADDKEKIDKLKEQLYRVKSNREYDALTLEMDHLKNELDDQEMKELELSDEKDILTKTLEENESQNTILIEKLNVQKNSLDKNIIDTKEEHDKLKIKRSDIVIKISEQHIGLYNKIKRVRDGIAVVPVINQSCGGCHSKIPSQLEVFIRDSDNLTQCNVCRQILYWDDTEKSS